MRWNGNICDEFIYFQYHLNLNALNWLVINSLVITVSMFCRAELILEQENPGGFAELRFLHHALYYYIDDA